MYVKEANRYNMQLYQQLLYTDTVRNNCLKSERGMNGEAYDGKHVQGMTGQYTSQ